jgi:hypothetical protein
VKKILWQLLTRRIAALQRYFNRRMAAKREEAPNLLDLNDNTPRREETGRVVG